MAQAPHDDTESTSNADVLAHDGGTLVRRTVNRTIYDAAANLRVPDDLPLEFVCECGDLNCSELVNLPFGEFDLLSPPGTVVAH